jgi:DNA-binding CsgD family transcriptional regulator
MLEDLSAREREIFNLLLEGISPKEIAYRLHVSDHTVAFHRGNLYRKLGINSLHELFAKYSSAHLESALPDGTLVPVNDLTDPPEQMLHFVAVPQKRKWLRLLIPVCALIIAVSMFLTWFFLIKPSAPKVEAIASRTYDTINLRAERWKSNQDHGEIWTSKDIKLSSFFTGTLKRGCKFQISGTVNKELKHVTIDLFQIQRNGDWKWVGAPNVTVAASGSFNIIIDMYYLLFDLAPSDKEVIVQLNNVINAFGNIAFGAIDSGKIPEDIPGGTIMATIRDFTISVIQ